MATPDPVSTTTFSSLTGTEWAESFPSTWTEWTDQGPSTFVTTVTATMTGNVSDATPSAIYIPYIGQTLTTGAVIGISIGAALGGLAVGSLLIWLLVRRILRRRQMEEKGPKGRTSRATVIAEEEEEDERTTAGVSLKEEAVTRFEPVYEMDNSTMRREMSDTGPQGELEGRSPRQPADADR